MKVGDLVRVDDMVDVGIVLEIWIGISPCRSVDEIDEDVIELRLDSYDKDDSIWIECLWENEIDGISADEVTVINEAR